jgi:hypothetical protein
MIEQAVRQAAIAVSYFWELLALPSHTTRLARLRMARQQAERELGEAIEAELRKLQSWLAAAAASSELAMFLGITIPQRMARLAETNHRWHKASGPKSPPDYQSGNPHREKPVARSDNTAKSFVTAMLVLLLTMVVLSLAGSSYLARTFTATRSRWLLASLLALAGSLGAALVSRNPFWLATAAISVAAAFALALALNHRGQPSPTSSSFDQGQPTEPLW